MSLRILPPGVALTKFYSRNLPNRPPAPSDFPHSRSPTPTATRRDFMSPHYRHPSSSTGKKHRSKNSKAQFFLQDSFPPNGPSSGEMEEFFDRLWANYPPVVEAIRAKRARMYDIQEDAMLLRLSGVSASEPAGTVELSPEMPVLCTGDPTEADLWLGRHVYHLDRAMASPPLSPPPSASSPAPSSSSASSSSGAAMALVPSASQSGTAFVLSASATTPGVEQTAPSMSILESCATSPAAERSPASGYHPHSSGGPSRMAAAAAAASDCGLFQNPVALIQISTGQAVMLFQTRQGTVPPPTLLRLMLQDPRIAKVGISPSHDQMIHWRIPAPAALLCALTATATATATADTRPLQAKTRHLMRPAKLTRYLMRGPLTAHAVRTTAAALRREFGLPPPCLAPRRITPFDLGSRPPLDHRNMSSHHYGGQANSSTNTNVRPPRHLRRDQHHLAPLAASAPPVSLADLEELRIRWPQLAGVERLLHCAPGGGVALWEMLPPVQMLLDLRPLTRVTFVSPSPHAVLERGHHPAKTKTHAAARGLIDMQTSCHASMFSLCRDLLGLRYQEEPEVTLSRWSRHVLSATQRRYAATDAWISLRLWRSLIAHPIVMPAT
ncbi:hypothetical protein PAPYR_1021 [Paratrimastix pyriformis]|uniref:3'-5' exonuclease n=1 Tax=Paratrimastix pyriformis TaxID=342808 RepID=A0ABQ8UXA1_9EUKA|nr:hypothetical protein PAPYR_1021 [Paratrimastix pyriformis]